VHGTDIFNKALDFFNTGVEDDISYYEMTIHKISSNNLILNTEEDHFPENKVAVNCYFTSNNKKIRFALIEHDNKIDCRYRYDEDAIINSSVLDLQKQSIILSNYSHYTTIEKIVALNKGLHHRIFKDVKGKWYFTKIRLNEHFNYQNNPGEVKLLFIKNFNYKLTSSSIEIDGDYIGEIYFSLV
jgi:hypothetical protein